MAADGLTANGPDAYLGTLGRTSGDDWLLGTVTANGPALGLYRCMLGLTSGVTTFYREYDCCEIDGTLTAKAPAPVLYLLKLGLTSGVSKELAA